MISHKHHCIFIHIPKTGGTSITNIIWPNEKKRSESELWMGLVKPYYNKYQTGGLQHLLGNQIAIEVGEYVYSDYFKFTLVRNPWDKAISQFSYMQKRHDLRSFIGMGENDSFKIYLELIKKKKHVQWESQHKFILDNNGSTIVDFVGRFEDFENDVRKILIQLKLDRSYLGLKKTLIPHDNKSVRKHYSEYYDKESQEMVAELYVKDIEYLGYRF